MTFSSQSSVLSFRRFFRDERGQGMIFAAASLVVLVGFVAMVYNLGRVIEGRTRMQLAADSAAYSGAMVEADALSAIGWINSAMAQTYYNSLKYAVDVNVTAVAARMAMLQNPGVDPQTLLAVTAHQDAWRRAQQALPLAKTWMVQLSQTENAVAILTPRLLAEEMFATATRAGGERLSLFPAQRFFPYPDSGISYRVEQFGNGWRITNLTSGKNEVLEVLLIGSNEWHITYTLEGITEQEVVIMQEAPNRWKISFYDHGTLTQEIYLVKTDDLGWVVWGRNVDPSGNSTPLPNITFEKVDMDGDGIKEGTKVTCNDVTQTIKRGDDGDMYLWSNEAHDYINMTSSTTTIAGVEVRVNVTNVINFPGGASAHIGDPTEVTIGRAHIVLNDPPTISTGLGEVRISIHGFDPNSFGVSVGAFSLTAGDADGRWRKWFNPIEEVWSRQRLTEQEPTPPARKQWQYDHQTLGAMMAYETNLDRYIINHAFGDRGIAPDALPEWTVWFDPILGKARPGSLSFRHTYPTPTGLEIIRPNNENPPPEDVYFQTELCSFCSGTGIEDVPNDPNDPSKGTHQQRCHVCHGIDHDGNGLTDIRIFIADIPGGRIRPVWIPPEQHPDPAYNRYITDGLPDATPTDTDYLDSRVHTPNTYNIPPMARYPLVLTPDFFKYGVNVGAYKSPDTPMLFPKERQPAWGYVALSSSRVGIPDSDAPDGVRRYHFDDPAEREDWVSSNLNNLYMADMTARLYTARDQVRDYDLDRDILQGVTATVESESALSYLWDALLGTGYSYWNESNGWLDQFDGRSDPRVGAALRNMTNRAGARFDYGDQGIGEVVEH